MPLWTTTTRSGSTFGYAVSTSARMPWLTAMMRAAPSYAVRSTQEETRYPPPSCSSFHGRSGSREWALTTWGTPCRSAPT